MADTSSNWVHRRAVDEADAGPRDWLAGAVRDVVQIVRVLPAVIVHPIAVLARWQSHPKRYPSPARMLGLYATLCGIALYALTVSGAFAEVEQLREAVRQVSRLGGVLLDGWNAIMPLAMAGVVLVGARVGALLLPGDHGRWHGALRVTAMMTAVYLVVTPIQFALRPVIGGAADWGTAAVAFVYGVLAFRGLSGESWARCALAQLVSSAIALAGLFAYSMAGGFVVGIVLSRAGQ